MGNETWAAVVVHVLTVPAVVVLAWHGDTDVALAVLAAGAFAPSAAAAVARRQAPNG